LPGFKQIYLFFVESLSDLFTEHVDVGLVDVPALIDEGDGIIDLDVVQLFGLLLPVLVQNKQ
jgi:hypothetical protein